MIALCAKHLHATKSRRRQLRENMVNKQPSPWIQWRHRHPKPTSLHCSQLAQSTWNYFSASDISVYETRHCWGQLHHSVNKLSSAGSYSLPIARTVTCDVTNMADAHVKYSALRIKFRAFLARSESTVAKIHHKVWRRFVRLLQCIDNHENKTRWNTYVILYQTFHNQLKSDTISLNLHENTV